MNSVATTHSVGAFTDFYCASSNLGENSFLKFELSREQCLEMIKEVLSDLGADFREFGDRLLCVLREGYETYVFELNIQQISISCFAVHMNNLKKIHSLTELIEIRFELALAAQELRANSN